MKENEELNENLITNESQKEMEENKNAFNSTFLLKIKKKGTFFVNLWKGLSWFLLMGTGIFICCMPWLAASFGLVFPAMLALGLIIAIPSAMMVASSVLNICHKHGLAKLIKNIAFSAMALTALAIGILLLATPGLPIISAFAGMIGGLGSVGALLTKISLIVFSVCKLFDVAWDFEVGSKSRAVYGAIGKELTSLAPKDFSFVGSFLFNSFKAVMNLVLIALAIVVYYKISLAFGLILAIPPALKLVANVFDKQGSKLLHQVAKWSNNLVRGAFGATLTFMGISLLKPTILVGFLGKLSIAAVFPGMAGMVGLVAGISLIVFGALMLAKTVTDVICGDQEKFKQGIYEIAASLSKSMIEGGYDIVKDVCLNVEAKKDDINALVPGLIKDNNSSITTVAFKDDKNDESELGDE